MSAAICFVKAHVRKNGLVRVHAYWRGNGSAHRSGKATGKVNGSTFIAEGTAEEISMSDMIRQVMNNTGGPKDFREKFETAKSTRDTFAEWEWMTDTPAAEKLENATLHATKGGSVVAIDESTGHIIGLMAKAGDTYSERDLMDMATGAGAVSVDSFGQDYEFYLNAGYIPVAWTRHKARNMPASFDPELHPRADQFYFVHESLCTPEEIARARELTLDEWQEEVMPKRTPQACEKFREEYIAGTASVRERSEAVKNDKNKDFNSVVDHYGTARVSTVPSWYTGSDSSKWKDDDDREDRRKKDEYEDEWTEETVFANYQE